MVISWFWKSYHGGCIEVQIKARVVDKSLSLLLSLIKRVSISKAWSKRGSLTMSPKPSQKIGTAKRHLLELYRPKLYTFFRNKSFFKIGSWNFQHLLKIEFHETSQNFNSCSSFRQVLSLFILSVVWLSWGLMKFCFKHVLKVSVSWKTKKFYSLKNIF